MGFIGIGLIGKETSAGFHDQFNERTTVSPRTGLELRATPLKGDGFEQIRDQFRPHVRNFLECVKSRKQRVSDLESGHKTATACHLANIAMRTGRTIAWDPAREEIAGDAEASKLLTKLYRSPWDRELEAALPKLR